MKDQPTMKRGFLNTARYKQAIDEAYASEVPHPAESCTPPSPEKEKSDVEADQDVKMTVDEDAAGWDKTLFGRSAREGTLPPRPLPPGRPGWGRRPEEEFFHTVPASLDDGTESERKRVAFRLWPRNRNAKVLAPDVVPQGTLSPDGYPWAETLYDIFLVNRLPEIDDYVVTVTGSKLCAAVEELGELDVAAPEIRWAKSEGRPRIEGAADTEELIRRVESKLPLLPSIISTFENENGGPEHGSEQDKKATDERRTRHVDDNSPRDDIPPSESPTIPITSLFHPSHYPTPLPLTPFAYGEPMSILLQEGIPLHLLPQTLYVHDPFCLLSAVELRFRDTSWTSRPDVVRTYTLDLSKSVSQIEEARQKAEELEEFKARTLIVLRYQRTEEQIKNSEPAIEIPLPPYSRRPTKIEESHLYISPVAKVGKGHHSFVYKGEWELPRALFVKQRICPQCFKESIDKEIQRLKDTGKWAKLMKLARCGPNVFTQAELDEIVEPPCLERDGEIIERELTCVVSPKLAQTPAKVVEFLDNSKGWDMFMKHKETTNKMRVNFVNVNDSDQDLEAAVPSIRIDVPFSSETSCAHRAFQGPIPPTAKFNVVAKLSIKDDYHLAREARNYQQFPEHLFHHYNGYTIIRQLHAIVPVHAVVPQFYGYYMPDENKEVGPGQPSYLSPILLLEHCGKPIDPEELTHEDQEECASLLLRFQRAGWLHESVAPRNFLVQHGKPTEFPSVRKLKPELSFRLIDFGRSRRFETVKEKQNEEVEVLKMFGSGELPSQMGLTMLPFEE